jgi:hypothetical protein
MAGEGNTSSLKLMETDVLSMGERYRLVKQNHQIGSTIQR